METQKEKINIYKREKGLEREKEVFVFPVSNTKTENFSFFACNFYRAKWYSNEINLLFFALVVRTDRIGITLDSGFPKFFALGASLSHFPRCSLCQPYTLGL